MLLLHYTGMELAEAALDWLTRQESGVSCHYLVDEEGRIAQLVPKSERAWHAGQSLWAGETDLNSCSIGIEIHNPGHDFDYPDFPEAEMQAVEALCLDILSRHAIPPHRVLAHSDVAPGRKRDPGEKFDWQRLAQRRHRPVGAARAARGRCRPGPRRRRRERRRACSAPCSNSAMASRSPPPTAPGLEKVVEAFQRHFRPARIDGRADKSTATRWTACSIARAQAAMACADKGRPLRNALRTEPRSRLSW